MATILDSLAVGYTAQSSIGNLICDFLILDCRLVIEVDGDYWHGNPIMFPDPSGQQAEQHKRDSRRDWFLRRRGFAVLRVWASDIESSPSNVINAILQKLQQRRASLARHKANPCDLL